MKLYQYLICGGFLIGASAIGCSGTKKDTSVGLPQASVSLLWNEVGQSIDGFGIAQAGWADQLYAHKNREKVVSEMFGQDGLRLNILRGEIFPHYWEDKNDKDFNLTDDLNIALTDSFFDKKSDDCLRRGQLWLTQEVKKKYNVDKIFFSAWSAPAYMKSNGNVSQGELKPQSYQEFADYLAAFYKAYTSIGLEPYAISPSNEPAYAAPWNSSLWTPEKMGEFIVHYLGPTFKREQIPARIIFGENPLWSAVSSQAAFASSLYFTNMILEKYPEIIDFNLIAAGHGYTLPESLSPEKDSLRTPIVPLSLAEEKGIPVWVTEISDITPLDTSMNDGLKWASTYHAFLAEAHVNAFVWWAGAMPTGNNESLIVLSPDREGYSLTKRYETFGNFSRYIKPGSERVATKLSGETDSLLVSAYKFEKTYTIVLINNSEESIVVSLQLDDCQVSGNLDGFLTDEKNRWASQSYLPTKDGQYLIKVPACCVMTFTGDVIN